MSLNCIDTIFVINLEEDTQRMKHMQEQFEKYNITNWYRYNAVNGKKIDRSITDKYIKKSHSSVNRVSAYGIAKTHTEIYKLMLEKGIDQALILEDDVTFTHLLEDFPKVYNNLPSDWDLVWVGNSRAKWPRNTCSIIPDPEYQLEHTTKITNHIYKLTEDSIATVNYPMGAYAYLINSKCIPHILKKYEFQVPIDVFLVESNLNKYMIIPSMIIHCFDFGSHSTNNLKTTEKTINVVKIFRYLLIIFLMGLLLFAVFSKTSDCPTFCGKKLFITVLLLFVIGIIILICIYKDTNALNMKNQDELVSFDNIWKKNPKSYKESNQILNALFDFSQKFNVDYAVGFGTLLGYARHQDFIPWDDDIDIMIDENDLTVFENTAFPYLKQNYNISFVPVQHPELPNLKYKLFYDYNENIKGYDYSWSFVDIFTYVKKSPTEIYYPDLKKTIDVKEWKIINSYMGQAQVKVPSEYKSWLDQVYPQWDVKCISSGWNHRKEKKQKSVTVDCNILKF